jgi:hypothetical protein
MADEKKQPTKEEIEKKRAESREVALKTFKGKMLDLATAFYVDNDKGYGEKDNAAVDDYIYSPAMGSDEYKNLMKASRQGGKRYTGSEYGVIQSAAKIVRESLMSLTVQDILNLMGSKAEVREDFEKGYMADYMQSGNDDAKKFAQQAIGTYLNYLTQTKVAEALTKQAQASRGSLEDIVKKEEPKKAEAQKGKKK